MVGFVTQLSAHTKQSIANKADLDFRLVVKKNRKHELAEPFRETKYFGHTTDKHDQGYSQSTNA